MSPSARYRRRSRADENGMALIASLLVMMVCVILVAAAMQLAIHNTQRSGLSRNRTASLHAAEAGIEAALSTLASSSACPAATGEVILPDQNLPTESYKILAPVSCAAGGNAVIASVGYVPNAAHAVATTTLVAHIDRGQGAPVSGGSGTNGGYVFPDAIFSNGAVTALAPVGTLSAYGTGGTVPNIVANGAIKIAGSQLDGQVRGWNTVDLTVPAIGSGVIGAGVTLSGATLQGTPVGTIPGGAPGSTGVISTSGLTLTNSTVNGTVSYGGSYSGPGSTVTGGGTAAPASPAPTLPNARQMPVFTDSSADMQSAFTGLGTPSNSCPGVGTGSYYDIPLNLACTYNPPTINGIVVLVVHGGTLTVTVPQTTTGGQLYVISANGLLDNMVLNGTNSPLPVFAFTDGPMTINGGITGQLLAASVTTTAATTLTFAPPAIPAPDFAFNTSQVAPSGLGYAASVAFEYQCPGATAC